ncbi:16866_t:CDS:2 [Dentiscutata erythropus]|uniref:16866_t:CDS:1 n=1 Tax=Dentiscutata erythropus TaxID=1348616 RepID=A0A9N9GME3_9GLOM|nr:16866_t:CDS:2 [Dentiscutata erythropus]
MRMQLFLLEDKYPDILFLPYDLSLTIQSFKQHNKIDNEASALLETLLKNKAQDPNWVVCWRLEPISNSLELLLWMEPTQNY